MESLNGHLKDKRLKMEVLEVEDLSFTDNHPYLSKGAGAALVSYLGEQIDAMPFYPAPGYARTIYDEGSGVSYFVIKLRPVWRWGGDGEGDANGF